MNPTSDPTRRNVLRTGGLGVAAAAFLAACSSGSKHPKPGVTGDPAPPTHVPVLPEKAPTAAALEQDQTTLRTAASLELLAAETYAKFSSKLQDASWKPALDAWAAQHTAAAEAFNAATDAEYRVTEANEAVRESNITPMEPTLLDDAHLLNFFGGLESTLAATYVTGAGSATNPELRALFAGYAVSSARRRALLGDGGAGLDPISNLFPLNDLIPGTAYLTVGAEAETTAEGDEAATDEAEDN